MRLLKVVVMPEFVVEDDDGNLAPLASAMSNEDGSPLRLVAEVPAKDWPAYAAEGFVTAQSDIERRLNVMAESNEGESAHG